MSKHNIDPELRGFYFASSVPDDTLAGTSIEIPKKTPQAAIDAAGLLVPPPSGLATAQITAAQGGSFTDTFVLPDGVQFEAGNVSFITDAPISAEIGSFMLCRVSSMRNSYASGINWNIDGKSQLGVITNATAVLGDGGIGFNITGECQGIFCFSSQIALLSDNSIGVKITADSSDPIDINADVVLLNGANSVFMEYDPAGTANACAVTVSSVFSEGATFSTRGTSTSIGYRAKGGHLSVSNLELIASLAIKVEDSAEFDIFSAFVVGDIVVDEGAEMNAIIIHHEDGAVINDGIINGIIDGKPYGTYRQKHQEQQVLNASDFTTQSPDGTDDPYKVLFGPAQIGLDGVVEVDAAGNITTNRADQYNFSILLEYGRTNAGSFSRLIFRLLVNGDQLGDSQYAQIDTSKTVSPIQFSGPLDLVEDDVVTVEIIRDSTGFDDGSLFPLVPALAGVNPAPSALLMISRNRLVQPV